MDGEPESGDLIRLVAATEIVITIAPDCSTKMFSRPATSSTMAPTYRNFDMPDRSRLMTVARLAIAKKHPSHSWTNVEYWSAIVLDVADVPPAMAPAMFACSRTAGWSAHVLEQKRLGVLVRPSARYIGPESRPLGSI